MRIIGLLCWYDEPPAVLRACLEGLDVTGVDHLVAVDGAYALFPEGKRESLAKQTGALAAACRDLGIGHTLYTPDRLWEGNEVEKRTFMHKLALSVSDPGDWHLVMDADQVVVESPSDLRKRLMSTTADVAEVAYRQGKTGSGFVRCLFRAIPLSLERNHYTYVTRDNRILWSASNQPQEGALDLHDLVFEHRPLEGRPPVRVRRKNEYYASRDEGAREQVMCTICVVGHAQKRAARNWRHDGGGGYIADWIEVCVTCSHALTATRRSQFAAWGLDPDSTSIVTSDGMAHLVPGERGGMPDLFREWLEGKLETARTT